MSTLEIYEESNLECYCGLPAKLRIARTLTNPDRLFYNCPEELSEQCGFFQWADEPEPSDDRPVNALDFICSECIRLQERLDEIEEEHDNERAEWEREKSEMTLQMVILQSQLDDIKNRINIANESSLMPPLDTLSVRDDGEDDVVVYTL